MQLGSVDAETLHLVTALVRSSNTYELRYYDILKFIKQINLPALLDSDFRFLFSQIFSV